jgi:hypothetical protein
VHLLVQPIGTTSKLGQTHLSSYLDQEKIAFSRLCWYSKVIKLEQV